MSMIGRGFRIPRTLFPAVLVVLAVVGLGVLVWTPSHAAQPGVKAFPAALPGSSPPSEDPWHDRAWLAAHLAKACDAVEWICGTPYPERPTLRGTTAKEIALVLRESVARRRELGLGPYGITWADDKDCDRRAHFAIGRYVPELNLVCVSRAVMEESVHDKSHEPLLSADSLRLVLVHEATHALDIQRFPHFHGHRRFWWFTYAAKDAVMEGHAQHVTRLVAQRWGLESAFKRIRGMYEEERDEESDVRRATSYSYTEYVEGQDFVDAIFEHAGRFAVDEALANPPGSLRMIRDPDRWFATWAQNAGIAAARR